MMNELPPPTGKAPSQLSVWAPGSWAAPRHDGRAQHSGKAKPTPFIGYSQNTPSCGPLKDRSYFCSCAHDRKTASLSSNCSFS